MVCLVAGFLVAGPLAGVAGMCVAMASRVMASRREQRRVSDQLEEQLADGVSSVSAGLRAGLSLSQALGFAAAEAQPPLSREFAAIVERQEMGVPFDKSLREWEATHDWPDVRLAVGVFRLHRRTGGDLPRVLDRLAATLRERRSASREARSMTAQARLSGIVLGFLPVGFFLFLSLISPEDMSAAYHSPVGVGAITAGIALQAGAFFWIRHLLKVAR